MDPQQRDPDVISYGAFDGLRNDVSPERFALGDLAVASNVDIDKSGRLARRGGYTQRVAGAAHSLWSDELQDICLFAAGGALKRLNADLTASTLTPLADALARVSCARVNDRVYWSNGTDVGIVEAGAVRSWGLPIAPLPQVSVAVGSLPAGTYQFAMTWLRADGQESGCGIAGTAEVPASGALQFTFPVPAIPGVVGKVLYLSPPNTEVMFEAAQLAAADTVLTITAPPAAAYDLKSQFLSPAPAGQLVAFYRGQMFVAVGDTLFWSQPYDYERFDLRRYLQLDGRITMLAPITDKELTEQGNSSGFFVGTDRSCGVLAGSDPDKFQYVPKTDYGAIFGALDYADASLLRDGQAGARMLPIFLTTQGICVGMPDLVVNNLTRTKFSFPASGSGAALFMPGPNRFIATSNF